MLGCHENGHIQRDCIRPKCDKNDSVSQLPDRKRWGKRSRPKGHFGRRREIFMLSRQANDTINAVKKYTIDMTIKWVLDSSSDCHVFMNKEIPLLLLHDDGPMVFD